MPVDTGRRSFRVHQLPGWRVWLGVEDSDNTGRVLADMRALGAEEVLIASNTVRGGEGYSPVVDGYVLPAPAMDIYGQKTERPAEVVIGVNAHEFTLFLPRFYAAFSVR